MFSRYNWCIYSLVLWVLKTISRWLCNVYFIFLDFLIVEHQETDYWHHIVFYIVFCLENPSCLLLGSAIFRSICVEHRNYIENEPYFFINLASRRVIYNRLFEFALTVVTYTIFFIINFLPNQSNAASRRV